VNTPTRDRSVRIGRDPVNDGVQADVAIVNAGVFTADAARSWSDAVAVRGDRIVAVGGSDVTARIGPATEVIDAAGGLVLPRT
jgi:predicted amidohydrolase YtcJ